MTVKELISKEVERGLRDLMRSARAMPDEKLNWKPTPDNRSALELLQECAQSMKWPMFLLAPGGFGGDPTEAFEKARREREAWTSVDACEEAAKANWAEAKSYIANYDESDLDREIELPFAPDLKLSVAEILASPYWNVTYHLGQLNYVQLMYGDKEMH